MRKYTDSGELEQIREVYKRYLLSKGEEQTGDNYVDDYGMKEEYGGVTIESASALRGYHAQKA